MIVLKRVTDQTELVGILELQQENLRKNIAAAEAESQGFLTAEYSLEFLTALHQVSAAIIAKEATKIVGYALVADKSTRHGHPLLADLFDSIDKTMYESAYLAKSNYVVVGQLCVAKGYRGQGLVQQLYQHFKASLSNQYQYLITDVAQANTRSLKAHKNTGFQVIDSLSYGGIGWDIVLWDWNK